MTLLAAPAKPGLVDVILRMAAVTLRRGRKNLVFCRPRVAKAASRCLVLAIQGKLGKPIVIELTVFPGAGVVALTAIRTEPFLVLVILHMAGHARDLGILEAGPGMALGARQRRMFTQQGKAGQSMVKLRHLPVAIGVAFLTARSFLTFVLVVFPVATEALHRRFSETAQFFVTGFALDSGFRVRVAQGELCLVVEKPALGVFPLLF